MAVAARYLLDLPDDCWKHVFKFIAYDNAEDDGDYLRLMKSLSVVSKEFLTITNRLQYSLTISTHQSQPHLYDRLSILFKRFTNLTSLDLSHTKLRTFQGDLNNLLLQISQFPLKLTSLTLPHSRTFAANGLLAFLQKITTLTSLTCSCVKSIDSNDIFFIADCFPLLEELNLENPFCFGYCTNIVEPLSLALFKIRKVNLSSHDYINDKLLFHLFKNCKLLEEANFSRCFQLTNAGIASALLERPTLKSLSFDTLQDWTMLFAFTRNCPSLSEITVQDCKMVDNIENFNSFVVSPQLKSLRFACDCDSWLTKETIKVFALFPNLVRLDLRWCNRITEEFMCQLLRMCCKLKHLDLSHSELNVSKMDFEVPKLEVLNLSYTSVDDNTLHVISKSCCGLLQLILEHCRNVTERGVKHVAKNCKQLRMINLKHSFKVDADVASLILLSRPSLIKIIAPPRNITGNSSCPQYCEL